MSGAASDYRRRDATGQGFRETVGVDDPASCPFVWHKEVDRVARAAGTEEATLPPSHAIIVFFSSGICSEKSRYQSFHNHNLC